MLGNTDQTIYVPLSTLQGMMSKSVTTTGQHIVNSIALTVTDKDMINTVKENITSLLQIRHNIALGEDNDFTVTSMDELDQHHYRVHADLDALAWVRLRVFHCS